MSKNMKRITIYTRNEMMGNINAIEAHLIDFGFQDYAQYSNVPFVNYLPKRARKSRKHIVSGYDSFLVIVEGWGHVQPAGIYDGMLTIHSDDVAVTRARYGSFDERWVTDFVELLEAEKGLVYVVKVGKAFQKRAAEPAGADLIAAEPAGADLIAAEPAGADLIAEAALLLRAAKSDAYQSRMDYKKARFEQLAELRSDEANRLYSRARSMASVIPFGQPIHPEPWRRDRSFRDRIHNTYGASFKAQEKAKYYEERADTLGSGGISSNDGEALTKLKAELEKLEKFQEQSKVINKAIRKLRKSNCLTAANIKEALPNIGDSLASKLAAPDFAGRYGVPNYELANNSANMRRIKQRIEELSRKEAREAAIIAETGKAFVEQVLGCVILREDFEENRIQIKFPERVGDESYKILRRHGFVYSRTNKAFQRQLNAAGRYQAKEVLRVLSTVEPHFFESDATKPEAADSDAEPIAADAGAEPGASAEPIAADAGAGQGVADANAGPICMHYSQRWGFVVAGAESQEVRTILEENGLKYWEPLRLYYLPGTKHHPRSRRIWELMERIAGLFDQLEIAWELDKSTAKAIDAIPAASAPARREMEGHHCQA